MRSPLIIGTRGSDLALWQANYIKSLLEEIGQSCILKIIQTQGDSKQELSLDKLEGKGFFTKEIEEALLSEETDIAIHSFKDLPTESPEGLIIGAVSEREDPSDILIINKKAFDQKKKFSLRKNSTVGTSSARRKSQLLAFRPDVKLNDLRGNIPTRISKLREGQYDAILIAAAGVERLELDLNDFHVVKMDPAEFVPAPAQGILAIQIREKDKELYELLKKIDNPDIRHISGIERKVLNLFQGGCHTPVGVYAIYDDDKETYFVRVVKAKSWDKLPISVSAESIHPEQLAERVVEKINSVKPCDVFITRVNRSESYLRSVLEGNEFKLEERALIEIIPIRFGFFPDSDWIFFSSKHAVKYFFEQTPKLSKQKFGCVGKSTSEALRRFGHRADFIGSSLDTRMTGKQFASLAGSSKVLFPQAKESMRSIQQQFVRQENVFDLAVYETLKKNDGEMPKADIVVFTSPSNVEAWFENYTFQKKQKAIAMGDATANALRKHKIIPSAQPDTFDDAGLARAVFGASIID